MSECSPFCSCGGEAVEAEITFSEFSFCEPFKDQFELDFPTEAPTGNLLDSAIQYVRNHCLVGPLSYSHGEATRAICAHLPRFAACGKLQL